MFHSSSSLVVSLIALPAIFAQVSNTTSVTTAGAPSPTAATNTPPTQPVGASTTATSSDPTASTAVSTGPGPATGGTAGNSTFPPANFTPALATSTSCGAAQQNLNQCVTKVGRDISGCTNNVCLCQTYANIAACYNGCPDLLSQSQVYQAQSTQYCNTAGVKPNSTVDASPTNSTSSNNPTSTKSSTGSSSSSSPNSNSSSNANTFSAAKGNSGCASATVSFAGILGGLAFVFSYVVV